MSPMLKASPRRSVHARRRHDRGQDGRPLRRRSGARTAAGLRRSPPRSACRDAPWRSCPTKRRRRARARAPSRPACSSRSKSAPPTRLSLDDESFDFAIIDDTGGLLATLSANDQVAVDPRSPPHPAAGWTRDGHRRRAARRSRARSSRARRADRPSIRRRSSPPTPSGRCARSPSVTAWCLSKP